jgi:shikimate dehydrogenase
MHTAALAVVGLSHWRYSLLPVPPELVAETLRALPAAGFRGVNVTIPHKAAALAVADTPTARAWAIGAANTLVYDGAVITADNTDAPALITTLAALGRPPERSALGGVGST